MIDKHKITILIKKIEKKLKIKKFIYPFMSDIPSIINSKPIRTIRQTTPPWRKAIVAGAQLANIGTAISAQIGTMTSISPNNNSNHLFMFLKLE